MPPIPDSISLSASVVCYQSDDQLLLQALHMFRVAAHDAMQSGVVSQVRLWLIDNGPGDDLRHHLKVLLNSEFGSHDWIDAKIIGGHGNIGYGCGHNLAIHRSNSDYHLILNPDVIMTEDTLSKAILFMRNHIETGLLTPLATNPDGSQQYLCKRYPAVVDLALRGFAPVFVKRLFRTRLDRYEMRDVIGSQAVFDVPIVSGAFMFFRGPVLRQLRGFSKEYFLYFEDFDLSLRAAEVCRIAYVPSVRITHFGGDAAKKGIRHISLFMKSAFTFYRQHGWKWW